MHALYLKSGHAADEKEIEAANQLATKFGVRMEISAARVAPDDHTTIMSRLVTLGQFER